MSNIIYDILIITRLANMFLKWSVQPRVRAFQFIYFFYKCVYASHNPWRIFACDGLKDAKSLKCVHLVIIKLKKANI